MAFKLVFKAPLCFRPSVVPLYYSNWVFWPFLKKNHSPAITTSCQDSYSSASLNRYPPPAIPGTELLQDIDN